MKKETNRVIGHRRKLSTTIDPASYAYLELLVRTGRARNVAEAVDLSVRRVRLADNRAALEGDTAAYFRNLSKRGVKEEMHLGTVLDESADEIDFES